MYNINYLLEKIAVKASAAGTRESPQDLISTLSDTPDRPSRPGGRYWALKQSCLDSRRY